jgi:7-cyano-7-deazaguanine synthase
MKNKSNVCILFSGGIDSTACTHFYLRQQKNVSGLYIDYGQSSAKQESAAVKQLSKYFNITVRTIELRGATPDKKDYICGRNSFLLMVALMEMTDFNIIALGIHKGTDYNDCTPLFLSKMQSIYDLYMKGTVQIGAPFLNWSKNEIWQYCKINKIPIELAYSCEYGKEQPCGECRSCKDLEVLNAG